MLTRRAMILLVGLAQVAALLGSLGIPGLGTPGWHHLLSLGLAVAILVPFWKPLHQSRSFLGIGVLVTTVLAVGSGFFILYGKGWLKAHALVDWIKWWHVFWSWLGIAFFTFHTWINRVSLIHLWRGLHAGPVQVVLLYGGMLLLLVAMAYPWMGPARNAINDENYILLTWYTWLVLVAPSYAIWAGALAGRTVSALHDLNQALPRLAVRGFVDVALIPATILANISGFPITFWKAEVHGAGFKFAGKALHTLPSIVMAILIVVHVVHLWRPTRAHWRRWERVTRPSRARASGQS